MKLLNRSVFLTRQMFGTIGMVLLMASGGSAQEIFQSDASQAANRAPQAEAKIYRDRIDPHWLPGNNQFWYRIETGPGTHEFILVDAIAASRTPAFDHARLAGRLVQAGVAGAKADQLPVDQLEFFPAERRVEFQAGGRQWSYDTAIDALKETERKSPVAASAAISTDVGNSSTRTGPETSMTFVNRTRSDVEIFWLDPSGERRSYGKVRPGEEKEQHTFAGHVWLAVGTAGQALGRFRAEESPSTAEIVTNPPAAARASNGARARRPVPRDVSPDGKWRALIRDFNLRLQNVASGEEIALSTDGNADDAYSDRVFWSPDSGKVAAVRVAKGQEHKVYLIESSPKDQVQPKLASYDYFKPGDKLPHPRPHLFDVATRKEIPVSDDLFPNPFTETGRMDLRWAADSSQFTFLYNQRGHQILRVIAIDARTGRSRAAVEERSETFIDYSGKYFMEQLDATDEILWMSERDGWNHLYLYDARTGAVKDQITKGEWVVRGVDLVDREKRQIWFRAGGIRPRQDPYYVHYCRVNFDGSGLTVLTESDGSHVIQFSPDRRFFIDTSSRVDSAPLIQLRRSEDGRVVCEKLESADARALVAGGWKPPEPFVASGRDKVTPIYGVIFRPRIFDAQKKYPVIESIYAGPQDSFVPKTFRTSYQEQRLADLGFIVVKIDGMGTSNRSKKFHDVCWKNLGDAGFPDRILWIQAAAAKNPAFDLERVGLYGTSAGGQNALRGLLAHGDFYKAGVADSGCHDNRMDKIWWNEQWMGWPVGPHYDEQSNVTQASRLSGKLLLMVGEMDRNVDPASTMQVVNALIKAGKDFELLAMPGQGHGVAGTPYGQRRLQSFFVKNFLESPRPVPSQ